MLWFKLLPTYYHSAVSLLSRSCLGLNWVILHSVPVTSCYINLPREKQRPTHSRLGPNDRPKYISTNVRLETNEAIGFSYRAPVRGYRRMGTPKDLDLPKVYPIMDEDLMETASWSPFFVPILHFQLTSRFDFVSLSLHGDTQAHNTNI